MHRAYSPFRLIFLLATLTLTACASGPDADARMIKRMTMLFDAIYVEVQSVHIDPVDLRAFTVAGLKGLRKLEPSLTVEEADAQVTLAIAGNEIATADFPEDAAPAEEWALFARSMTLYALGAGQLLATAPEQDIYRRFFDASLGTLDRFTRYADPEDAAELKAEREGFGGIGVDLESHPDGVWVSGVEPGKPAAAAGLLTGDRIVAIAGAPVGGAPLRKVVKLLRGPIDTAVDVTIVRDGLAEPIHITVGRTRIVPNTVFYSRQGGHVVIRISSFNERTSKRLAEAVARARAEESLTGLVLDLRGNPGGLLDQAVDSADLFLDDGVISIADGRHPESHQRFDAEPGDIADGLPIVVLVNGASASAAEILTAALQDHGRAALVGMNTFGKGTIQTVIDLPNGGELYITWARFLAPSGYALQRLGVMPTVCTSGADDAVTTLEQGLSASGERSGQTLIGNRRSIDPSDEAAIRALLKLCPWRPHASGDIDLAIAGLLLDSPTLMRRAVSIAAGSGA